MLAWLAWSEERVLAPGHVVRSAICCWAVGLGHGERGVRVVSRCQRTLIWHWWPIQRALLAIERLLDVTRCLLVSIESRPANSCRLILHWKVLFLRTREDLVIFFRIHHHGCLWSVSVVEGTLTKGWGVLRFSDGCGGPRVSIINGWADLSSAHPDRGLGTPVQPFCESLRFSFWLIFSTSYCHCFTLLGVRLGRSASNSEARVKVIGQFGLKVPLLQVKKLLFDLIGILVSLEELVDGVLSFIATSLTQHDLSEVFPNHTYLGFEKWQIKSCPVLHFVEQGANLVDLVSQTNLI